MGTFKNSSSDFGVNTVSYWSLPISIPVDKLKRNYVTSFITEAEEQTKFHYLASDKNNYGVSTVTSMMVPMVSGKKRGWNSSTSDYTDTFRESKKGKTTYQLTQSEMEKETKERQDGSLAGLLHTEFTDSNNSGSELSVSKDTKNVLFDFDFMMVATTTEPSKKRKRPEIEIKDEGNPDLDNLIQDMRNAAKNDRLLNQEGMPETNKLNLLPRLTSQLNKNDLPTTFLEQQFLPVVTEWLAPLPDSSLPDFTIRETVLKQLITLPIMDKDNPWVKESGIEEAVNFLIKHPKETPENKRLARRFIYNWGRAKSNKTPKDTKQDLPPRDLERMPATIANTIDQTFVKQPSSIKKALQSTLKEPVFFPLGVKPSVQKPVQPQMLRVSAPELSSKNYLVRPKWNSEVDMSDTKSKQTSRGKRMRNLLQKSKQRCQKPVPISGKS